MIPVKLQLRNFMCYRGGDNAVSFDGIHLAALTGDNGQGKSALLDAMTWALWGKARAKRDDDLISHGENEMEVQLDFQLGPDRFRVARRRNSSGRGSSMLDLFAQRRDGTLASLSEPTLRETQGRITQLLRLDYNTFINASFLLQGRADEFTTRPPAQRKQILADILGLEEYEQLAALARSRARNFEEERALADQQLREIDAQIETIPALEEALIEAEGVVTTATARTREIGERHQGLISQREKLERKAEERTQAERSVEEGRREAARLTALVAEQRAKLAHFEALVARADEIGAVKQALAEARDAKNHWDERLNASLQLKSERIELEREIERARAALEAERRATDTSARNAAATIKRLESKTHRLAEARAQLGELERLQHERENEQEAHAADAQEQGRLSAENARLRTEMLDLKERIALLQGADEAECPVCRRPLSESARAKALEEAQAEGTGMGDRFRANQKAVDALAELMAARQQRIGEAAAKLKELQRWQRVAAEAASAAEEVRTSEALRATAEGQRRELDARLEANDYAHEARQALVALARSDAEIGYDEAAHQRARDTIQRLSPREGEIRELDQAQDRLPMLVELIASQEENHRRAAEAVARDEQRVAALNAELAAQPRLMQEILEVGRELAQAQQEQNRAQRDLGAQRQRLEYAEQQAARRPEAQARCDSAIDNKQLHDRLAIAFGKQGIPAMLIEAAIPELENEANALLDRMTDGRMSVRIETQRTGRTTDAPIETLDIVISDESGARAYETFSGGEAFRINFALRIALSKLLATRAGANLRTLIMDEGFGSQDARGRERLIEAITSVQEDFDRIIVITHIDELKDAFPVRLDVVKGERGSKVFVR